MVRIATYFCFLLWVGVAQSQTTYTLDPDFSAGDMLRGTGAVGHILPLDDGGYFLGGSFHPVFQVSSPFTRGIAMLTTNGAEHPDWSGGQTVFCRELHDHEGGYIFAAGQTLSKRSFTGESWFTLYGDTWGDYFMAGDWGLFDNPYNVNYVWDIYIQEDESVLIGGSIATDTLQPNLYRHLMKLHADGSHDDTFPIIEAMPQNPSTYVGTIEKGSNGYWYISGRFEGINGHYSPHIVRLTPEFEVDTDFVSPFVFESIPNLFNTGIKLIDSQDRLWMASHRVRLQNNPDTFKLVRLLPDGTVDPGFYKAKLYSVYPPEWQTASLAVKDVVEYDSEQGIYFVCGTFNLYNDTSQACITAINDAGYIQEHYFQSDGATENAYSVITDSQMHPYLATMELTADGSLMVGGGFSNFMGEEHYGVVRLLQGTINTHERNPAAAVKIYPNPADQWVQLEYELLFDKPGTVLHIYDELGRKIETRAIGQNTRGLEVIDTRALPPGLYIAEIVQVQEGKPVYRGKFMVQH